MLSSPDVVRLQVINFTSERFPITHVPAPLIVTLQHSESPESTCGSVRTSYLNDLTHLEFLLHTLWTNERILNGNNNRGFTSLYFSFFV